MTHVILVLFVLVFCFSEAVQAQIVQVRDRLNAPTLVFVPGVLGSRLLDEEGNAVWGNLSKSDPKLYYSGDSELKTEPLDSVSVFGVKLSQYTYGTYLDTQLNNLSVAENFYPFSYDWRASTRKSAEDFAKFICEDVPLNRPVIIVAHSMGGLLVKRWLMENFEKGCQGKQIDIHRLVFVATPHLGAPKAFSSLVLGMDLFGFSAVDGVISKGLNDFGLSFDSTYELLPFSNSYVDQSGDKERCFPVGDYGSERHRVLYKASDNTFYETVDIFSTTVLERLGVVARVEEMLQKVGSSGIDANAYLDEKLRSARSSICELASFVPPGDLYGKIIYFYGNLRTDASVSSTTVGQVIISDTRLPNRPKPKIISDANNPKRKLFVHSDVEPGDGTVPTSIAADPMERGTSEPRFGNSNHLGVLSDAGFRELASAMLSQNYAKSDRVKLEKINWDGVTFSNPIYAIAEQAIPNPDDSAFVKGLPPVENVIDGGRIKLDAFRDASAGEGLKIVNPSDAEKATIYGTVWDASAWEYILGEGQSRKPTDIFSYASEFPSAENWYVAGSIAGLEDAKIVEALTYAGGEYLARGDIMTARMIYSDTNSLIKDPTVFRTVDSKVLDKLQAGSALVDLYAGVKGEMRDDISTIEMIDFINAVTFGAKHEETIRLINEIKSFPVSKPTATIEDGTLVDSLRDDL